MIDQENVFKVEDDPEQKSIPVDGPEGSQTSNDDLEHEQPCANNCDGNCSCGHSNGTTDEITDADAAKDPRAAFFDDLKDLAAKYGGTIISANDIFQSINNSLPRCPHADTCKKASECPMAANPEIRDDDDPDNDFDIMMNEIAAINYRLQGIEKALTPPAGMITGAAELKEGKWSFHLRRRDRKKIRKAVKDVVSDELDRACYDLRQSIQGYIFRATDELKKYIGRVCSSNVILGSKAAIADTIASMNPNMTGVFTAIELPKPTWGIEEWTKFQQQITQHILSSKSNPAVGSGSGTFITGSVTRPKYGKKNKK